MIPELVGCFERTVAFIEESVADLSDEDIVLQPPGVPNHAAWTLGHVIYSCQAMAGAMGVEPWLPPDWESQFGYGSSPTALVSQRPTKAALLAGNRSRLFAQSSRHTPCAVRCPLAEEEEDGGRHTECACYFPGRERLQAPGTG